MVQTVKVPGFVGTLVKILKILSGRSPDWIIPTLFVFDYCYYWWRNMLHVAIFANIIWFHQDKTYLVTSVSHILTKAWHVFLQTRWFHHAHHNIPIPWNHLLLFIVQIERYCYLQFSQNVLGNTFIPIPIIKFSINLKNRPWLTSSDHYQVNSIAHCQSSTGRIFEL